MALLISYVVVAIIVSFLCSIFEAVLLSVTQSYIAGLQKEKPKAAQRLTQQKNNIDSPLIAILTLNTIAHTAGAAGAGAQAAIVFGSQSLGLFSAFLTFAILFFSEIIPKTIGANYWRTLAPSVSMALAILEKVSFPFVWLAMQITKRIGHGNHGAYIRQEMSAMAEIGEKSGELGQQESSILQQMLKAKEMPVTSVMTPRTVMFSVSEQLTTADFVKEHAKSTFSKVLIYQGNTHDVVGYVHRNNILLEEKKSPEKKLESMKRTILAIPETAKLFAVFELLMKRHTKIAIVVDEYGSTLGLVTMEDIIESLLGLEIIDSKDLATDMQHLARRLWEQRMQHKGIVLSEDEHKQTKDKS